MGGIRGFADRLDLQPLRTELEGRRLLVGALGLVLGLTLPLHLLNVAFLLLLCSCALSWEVRLIAIGAAALGVVLAPQPVPPQLDKSFFQGRVVVSSTPRLYTDRMTFDVRAGSNGMSVSMRSRQFIAPGDVLYVNGRVQPLNEGTEAAYESRGISAMMVAPRVDVIARGPAIFSWAETWRRSFVAYCESTMNPQVAGSVEAMCFGLRSMLSDDQRHSVQVSGAIHVLSASGLHILLLASGILWVLGLIPVPRMLQVLAALAVLGIYALATGLNPPTVRAIMIAGLGFCAFWVRREPDVLSALALACIGYLLWRPASVYEAGFQLSFLTVAIFAIHPIFRARSKSGALAQRVRETLGLRLAAALGVSLATLPLVAYHFGSFSVLSAVTNVVLLASTPVVILAAFAGHVLSYLSQALGQGIADVLVTPFAGWSMAVVDWGSASWGAVSVPAFSGYWLSVFYGVIVLAWRPRVKRP